MDRRQFVRNRRSHRNWLALAGSMRPGAATKRRLPRAHRACGEGDRVGDDAGVALDVTRPSAPTSAPIGPHRALVSAVICTTFTGSKLCKSRSYRKRSGGLEPAPVLAIWSSTRARSGRSLGSAVLAEPPAPALFAQVAHLKFGCIFSSVIVPPVTSAQLIVTGQRSAVAPVERLCWRPAYIRCRPASAVDGLLRSIGRPARRP